MQKPTFGGLLKRMRKAAGYRTLSQFADALSDLGLIYSESLLSRWQQDSRLPRDRVVYLKLIELFIQKKTIFSFAKKY